MKQAILACVIFLLGCASETENQLNGKWKMHKVIQDGKDVTMEHDPHDERFIIIKNDGNFESGGRPYGRNTGKYVFNKEEKILFLDSDAGPDDGSRWKITIDHDTVKWKGFDSEWADRFQIIQLKSNEVRN